MINIFSSLKIKNIEIKNRIVLPPMVRFSLIKNDGFVTTELINWYEKIASNGVGLIIIEASCVASDGKLRDNQIGIWQDDFISGLSEIAKVCKKYNVPSLIQIHHAGFDDKISSVPKETLKKILNQFIAAFKRAKKCGFDGIEIHGAHGYFLSQLNSKLYNTRDDEFGGSFYNRMRFNRLLIEGTKDLFDENFILGYRMGGNEPTLKEGIKIARYLEELGVDLLHISCGIPDPKFKSEAKVEVPNNFPMDWIIYLGTEIKKSVSIPVIGVRKIKIEEQASYLIENNMLDMVAIGRALIAKPAWISWAKENFDNRQLKGEEVTYEKLLKASKNITAWLKKKN